MQKHAHQTRLYNIGTGSGASKWLTSEKTGSSSVVPESSLIGELTIGRGNRITRGKRKGVKYIIKVL